MNSVVVVLLVEVICVGCEALRCLSSRCGEGFRRGPTNTGNRKNLDEDN